MKNLKEISTRLRIAKKKISNAQKKKIKRVQMPHHLEKLLKSVQN